MCKIIERIAIIIAREGITAGAMERKIGASKGVLSRAIANGTDVQSKWIELIAYNYPSYSARWLLTGKGEIIVSDQTTIGCTPPPTVVSAPTETHGDNIVDNQDVTHHGNRKCSERLIDRQSVPLYDTYAAAGIVQIIQGDHSHIPAEYITIPRAPRCDGAMYVSGDSMYPILKSGDIVMYTEVHDIDLYLQWGEMYIVAYGHEGDDMMVVVKYIQKADTPDMIRLVSHNQHHADKDIPKTAIRALGRVKASIRFQTM